MEQCMIVVHFPKTGVKWVWRRVQNAPSTAAISVPKCLLLNHIVYDGGEYLDWLEDNPRRQTSLAGS